DRSLGFGSVEDRTEDIRAVLDAVGSRQAILYGISESGPMVIYFAASHPERGIKGAVEAIKQGASDYITKPFQKEEILLATEKVLEKRRLLNEINYLRSQLSDRYSFANMVSRNRVMHEIFETISVLAQNDATVLI